VQKSLRLVFSLKPESLECPTEAELVAIERVLNLYDLIALRAKHRAIKCDDILESDWRIILPLWKKVNHSSSGSAICVDVIRTSNSSNGSTQEPARIATPTIVARNRRLWTG